MLQLAHEEGRISNVGSATAAAYRYEYALADHLGKLRVAFAEINGQAQAVQLESFGPWGESLPTLTGTSSISFANPYIFTGHDDRLFDWL